MEKDVVVSKDEFKTDLMGFWRDGVRHRLVASGTFGQCSEG